MATRKPATNAEANQLAQDIAQALAMTDETIDSESLSPALDALYSELGMTEGSEATVHVSKLDADGRGNEAQVWKGDPDQYDLETLAKKFGSGAYRVKVYVKIPTGQKVLKGNKVINWLLSTEDEAKRMQTLNPAPIQPQANVGAEIAKAVVEAMRQVMPAQPQAPAFNPMEMMSGLAGILKTLQPPQPVMQQAAQPQNPMGMIEMMKGMLEITQMMRGDSDPIERGTNANFNDLALGLIKNFAPALAGVMSQPGMSPMANPQPAQPQLTAPQPEPTQQPTPQGNEMDMQTMQLKMGIGFLIGQCEGGGDAGTYAEVVLDSMPEESVQQLMALPDPIAWLAQFDERVPAHAEWFKKLIEECKVMLAGDDTQGSETQS